MAADERVNRFLGWRLPDDFNPDCGISFKHVTNPAWLNGYCFTDAGAVTVEAALDEAAPDMSMAVLI